MPDDSAQQAGARLKHAREAKGISLREIADTTKISSLALQHVERGDLARLPGGIFGRAFVRSYATYVGLDAEVVLAEFFPPTATEDSPASDLVMQPHESMRSKWRQRLLLGRLAGLVPVIALATYGSITVSSWRAQPAAPVIPSSGIEAIRTHGIEAVPAEPAVRRIAHMLGSEGDALGVAIPDSTALTLELRPRAPCWVALSIDGQRANSRLLIAGERTVLTAKREIMLKVGDAGVLDFLINGRPARPLGADGKVATARISSHNFNDLLHASVIDQ